MALQLLETHILISWFNYSYDIIWPWFLALYSLLAAHSPWKTKYLTLSSQIASQQILLLASSSQVSSTFFLLLALLLVPILVIHYLFF